MHWNSPRVGPARVACARVRKCFPEWRGPSSPGGRGAVGHHHLTEVPGQCMHHPSGKALAALPHIVTSRRHVDLGADAKAALPTGPSVLPFRCLFGPG